MNSLSWARVKPVLEKALAAPQQDRDSILACACADDPELRREVEEYLRCQNFAEALLPATQWGTAASPEDTAPPEHEGPWRILREIGRGGMGVVYLAERDDGEYRQKAALKLVRDGRRNAAFEDLFRHERQVLAQLNHPGIARLLDGGTTAAGRPYYVMEFVEGEPLTQYCRQRALPVRSRIRLLIQVCDAVSNAHRNLIIHRDLKPGNILVTARGEPKLLDFGLSESCGPEPDGDLTATAVPLLTPAYASPEQIRGEHLTTASDLYSLGVILYELLAGSLPYNVQGEGLFQTWTAVCDQVPGPPSAVATAPHRYRHATDLDSIVLKAIRKEPAERYPSVEAFAADLELYLAGMPVRARQGNALYRLRRFVARHRWAVLGTTVAFAGMCISLGAVFWEQRQAALRFQQLRRFAHAVVFELHDAIENLPGSTAARALLIQRSLEYLRSLDASSGKDLGLKWELAEAYKRVGDAQGDMAAGNLGDSSGALDSYARARSLLNQIAAARPANVTTLKTLATVDSTTAGILLARGRQAEAVALRKEAVEALRKVALLSATPEARKALALSHYNLAVGLTQVRNWPAAAAEWREALGLFEEIANSRPTDLAARRNVALSHKRLAAVLMQQRDLTAAAEHYRAAEQIDRALLLAEPRNPQARMDLSFDLSDSGLVLLTLHRAHEAAGAYEEALALRREVAAADPDNFLAKATVGRSLYRVARAYDEEGRIDPAIEACAQAVNILAAAHGRDPANRDILAEAGLASLRLGFLHRERAVNGKAKSGAADWTSAQTAFEKASSLFNEFGAASKLPDDDQERIRQMGPALEECRRKASAAAVRPKTSPKPRPGE